MKIEIKNASKERVNHYNYYLVTAYRDVGSDIDSVRNFNPYIKFYNFCDTKVILFLYVCLREKCNSEMYDLIAKLDEKFLKRQ